MSDTPQSAATAATTPADTPADTPAIPAVAKLDAAPEVPAASAAGATPPVADNVAKSTAKPGAEKPQDSAPEPEPERASLPASRSHARFVLPIAAAIIFAAGLAGVSALALRGSGTEAMARLAAMETTLAAMAGEIATIKAQTAAPATPSRTNVSLAPALTRLDALGEALERAQKDIQARIATLATGERGSDKTMNDKLGALNTRLERMEKTMMTASLPTHTPAAPANQPLPPKLQPDMPLPRVPGYVLLEVENGIAVIEDRRGTVHELMRGEVLPGIGRIQKIERRAGAWAVVTDKGLISAR